MFTLDFTRGPTQLSNCTIWACRDRKGTIAQGYYREQSSSRSHRSSHPDSVPVRIEPNDRGRKAISSSGIDNVTVGFAEYDLTEPAPKVTLTTRPADWPTNEALTMVVNADRGVVQTNHTADAGMNEDVGRVTEAWKGSVEWLRLREQSAI